VTESLILVVFAVTKLFAVVGRRGSGGAILRHALKAIYTGIFDAASELVSVHILPLSRNRAPVRGRP